MEAQQLQVQHPSSDKQGRRPRRKALSRAAAPDCSLLTVEQFAQRWTAWTPAALRALIFEARDRVTARGRRIPGNGLQEAGAILRVGRRVLLDEAAFFAWLKAKQQERRA